MDYCGGENYLIALGELNALDRFRDYLRDEKSLSPETLKLYKSYIRQLFEFFVKATGVEHVQPYWANCNQQFVSNYLISLKEKGNAPRTIARKAAVIDSFFEFTVNKGYLRYNPVRAK
ncbi:MAG: site-specific integrase [Dehalococcoidia bacterium]